ncbi:MAG: hypothetical protein WDM70_03085 [Nitrosomonadales bacterium]
MSIITTVVVVGFTIGLALFPLVDREAVVLQQLFNQKISIKLSGA